ncbi:MAG: GntR family transcriptional regulator [Lachnospiraceae bacterium]|nr:GntR family transcriptional regulator [Lachnospiraceae bacterium]
MKSNYYTEMMKKYSDRPAREMVILTLRQAILTGRFMPGDRLMEIQLASQMGVSRTPVREAIKQLSEEGLVNMVPNRGAYVSDISEKGVMDVLEVRRTLEGLAVSRAVRRIDSEGLKRLNEAREKCAGAFSEGEYHEMAEADICFHDVILKATGNDRLVEIMNNLADRIYRYRYEFIRDPGHHQAIILEHDRVYEAISERNEDEAVAAMQDHIDHQAKGIITSIRAKEQKVR